MTAAANRARQRQPGIDEIQGAVDQGEGKIGGIAAPARLERQKLSGKGQQLNARCEPNVPGAVQGDLQPGAERMAAGALAGQQGEAAIKRRAKQQMAIIFRKEIGHLQALRRRIAGCRGQGISTQGGLAEFPFHLVGAVEAHHPGAGPGVEAFGDVIAGSLCVARRKKFDAAERASIADGPGHQRKEETHGHPCGGEGQTLPALRSPPADDYGGAGRGQQQRGFRTHERAESRQKSAKEPGASFAENFWARDGGGGWRNVQPGEKPDEIESGGGIQEDRQVFRLDHRGIIRQERAKSREPKSEQGPAPLPRRGSELGGDGSGQQAGEKVEQGLNEHDASIRATEHGIDSRDERRITRHAHIHG